MKKILIVSVYASDFLVAALEGEYSHVCPASIVCVLNTVSCATDDPYHIDCLPLLTKALGLQSECQ